LITLPLPLGFQRLRILAAYTSRCSPWGHWSDTRLTTWTAFSEVEQSWPLETFTGTAPLLFLRAHDVPHNGSFLSLQQVR
jgi:hypothetical protein